MDRCEHLFYTVGEWVYYAPDGVTSEDFPGGGFEEYDNELLLEAFGGEPVLAHRLGQGEDPLRILCQMALERSKAPKIVSDAGGGWPGSDSWSNTWVKEMSEVLSSFSALVECYLKGLNWLGELEDIQ